jgi:hypothetical protein
VQRENPTHVQRIPKSLEYLRIYALEMAYIEPPQQSEAPRAFRARVYETLRTIQLATNKPRDVRITLHYPTTDWDRVWSNLHATWAANAIKVNWFRVMYDILPTNERLHTIQLTDSAHCSTCGERDTIMHRITDCGEGRKYGNGRENVSPGYCAWIRPGFPKSGPFDRSSIYGHHDVVGQYSG